MTFEAEFLEDTSMFPLCPPGLLSINESQDGSIFNESLEEIQSETAGPLFTTSCTFGKGSLQLTGSSCVKIWDDVSSVVCRLQKKLHKIEICAFLEK